MLLLFSVQKYVDSGLNIIREALENLVLKKSFVSQIPSFLSNQMKGQQDIWQHLSADHRK
jgi:hypothetical protein